MLICLVMIIVVMMQESKNSGFGALSGQVDSDSFFRKLVLPFSSGSRTDPFVGFR